MAQVAGVRRAGRQAFAAVFLALLLLVTARLAAAETGALPVGANGSYVLTPALSYLEDPEQRLTLEDVAHPGKESAFHSLASEKPTANFGLTRSAYWLRITLQLRPEAPMHWLLEVGQPTTDRIELFMPRADGGFDRLVAGDLLPLLIAPSRIAITFSNHPALGGNAHAVPARRLRGHRVGADHPVAT